MSVVRGARLVLADRVQTAVPERGGLPPLSAPPLDLPPGRTGYRARRRQTMPCLNLDYYERALALLRPGGVIAADITRPSHFGSTD